MYGLDSEYTDYVYTYQIPTPVGLGIQNGVLSWTRFANERLGNNYSALRYKLKFASGTASNVEITRDILGNEMAAASTGIILPENVLRTSEYYYVSIQAFVASDAYEIDKKVVENGITYYIINSEYSSSVPIRLLPEPKNLSINESVLYWDAS